MDSSSQAPKVISAGVKCKRCQENDATMIVRNDYMCSDCFKLNIRTKFIKRMETYRVRNTEGRTRTLLLALSFGSASTALLSFLDWQLQSQLDRTGRAGYGVLALFVDQSCLDPSQPSVTHLNILEKRFPKFKFKAIGLERIYDYQQNDEPTRNPIENSENTENTENTDKIATYIAELRSLISSLPSRNSQMDVISLLRTRLLVEIAKQENCETILYGDTTTRLAEKTLAEMAKGRGRSIPWQISDGPTPYGVSIHYPLRDILRKELEVYVNATNLRELCLYPDSSTTPPPNPNTSRNLTIDELITHYFSEIEKKTPSIVANVVRTTSKLVVPDTAIGQDCCEVCGLPKDVDIEGWVNDEDQDDAIWSMAPLGATTQESGVIVSPLKARRCYGCRRTTLGAEDFKWPLKHAT